VQRLLTLAILTALGGGAVLTQAPAGGALSQVLAFQAEDPVNFGHIDETIAAGPASLILANNAGVALRTKAGAPIKFETLANFFRTVLGGLNPPFDVRALFDEHSRRFFVLAAARSTTASQFLLGVSKRESPDGLSADDWHFFALDAQLESGTRRAQWGDFPSLGVSEDAVIITMQMFPLEGAATADNKVIKIRVLEKARLLAGELPEARDFVDPRDPQSNALLRSALQPVQHFGRGRASFVVGLAASTCGFVVMGIDRSAGTIASALTASPDRSCRQATDAPQPSGAAKLTVNGGLRVPAVYRNGSLWIAEAVGRTYNGADVSAIRVTQLNVEQWPATPTVVQQAVIASEGTWRYYPALVVDADNNVGLVYGQSSQSEPASLFISGRLAGDPLNTLREPVSIRSGEAAMNLVVTNPSRGAASFGDYFGAAIDPSQGTMWVLGEYASQGNVFRRHAAEFRLR
jgi:hypothetical protein